MPDDSLVCTSPESVGIPTEAILDFLSEMCYHELPMHSYMVLRHGKVAAEGYCGIAFDAHRKHRLYSVSKSFTSVAVGMLIDEHRLSLDSRIADFFPEYLPENVTEYCLRATVRDLLRMATFNETNAYELDDKDFVKKFFDNDYPKQMPGTVFHYDTTATTTLCAVIEKITGMKMLDYMRPLFDELGISKDIWCIETPDGRSWPGSGILATTRDLAKFGLFCLHGGEWNGKQLVSREYMSAATSKQISTYVSDWSANRPGYGYQFWMIDGGFACCGMGGQFVFMFPDKDLLIVTTADTQACSGGDDQIRFAAVRLMKKIHDEALPEQPDMAEKLLKASHLTLPKVNGAAQMPLVLKVNGTTYDLDENRWGFRWLRVNFNEEACILTYEKKGKILSMPLFLGGYRAFVFPEKFSGKRIGMQDSSYRCLSQAAWDSDNTLLGTVYSVDDYLGTLKMQLTFVDDTLTVFMTKAAEGFWNDYRGYLAGRGRKEQ